MQAAVKQKTAVKRTNVLHHPHEPAALNLSAPPALLAFQTLLPRIEPQRLNATRRTLSDTPHSQMKVDSFRGLQSRGSIGYLRDSNVTMNPIQRPKELAANIWTGVQSPKAYLKAQKEWHSPEQPRIIDGRLAVSRYAPQQLPDLRDWRDPNVGWGILVPDRTNLTKEEKARGVDLPPCLKELVKLRNNAPILRWDHTVEKGYLRRYYDDGGWHPLPITASRYGIKSGMIPRYLLICASPQDIPWSIQYQLNITNYVGRLPFSGDALDSYVNCLLDGWPNDGSPRRHVIWSVDDGAGTMTGTMSRAIGRPLAEAILSDSEFGNAYWCTGKSATKERLIAALLGHRSSLICTTSHGMLNSANQPTLLHELGAPVDALKKALTFSDLRDWSPSGAIWYSHSCCSVGSDSASVFTSLFESGDPLGITLQKVAAEAGARVAPLPDMLLRHRRPLRAFIGHVEPTFDWTLCDPITQEASTHAIVGCLYNRLHQSPRPPIAWALEDHFKESAMEHAIYRDWKRDAQSTSASKAVIDPMYRQLTALDRQLLVILGDPTVTLPH